MRKITLLLLFISTVWYTKAQTNVLFVTDGGIKQEGQIINDPSKPNEKSTYFKVDTYTNVLPPEFDIKNKINLCVTEDVAIQFTNKGNEATIIMPSMEATYWAWKEYATGNNRQKYGQWLYHTLDDIQTQLEKYSYKILDSKPSNASSIFALWMMKVSLFILEAKVTLLEKYYGNYQTSNDMQWKSPLFFLIFLLLTYYILIRIIYCPSISLKEMENISGLCIWSNAQHIGRFISTCSRSGYIGVKNYEIIYSNACIYLFASSIYSC